MWTKLILTLVLLTLMPVMAASSGNASFRVTAPGPDPCQCAKGPRDSFAPLLPCAWKQAQYEVAGHYPQLARRVYALERSNVTFRQGRWYDDEFKAYIVGDTDLERDPPVSIGLTGDTRFDYETAVHEYKHFVVDSLKLGETAHAWVDSEDDEDR
ncbi:MAG: hypothetical protein V7641_4799 [Blastocatellia bacterium]